MSTAPRKTTVNPSVRPNLYNGDKMTREEFHSIYETADDKFKAELLGGIVYVSSPLKMPHGRSHLRFGSLLDIYQGSTAGVEAFDNTTVVLGKDDEVQPDLFLRILPANGGQTSDTYDGYVIGAPELVVEIAHSSRSIDLHLKRKRYAKAGVLEYIVACLEPKQVCCYLLQSGQNSNHTAKDGILKSEFFPGLWIDVKALFEMNITKSMEVLNEGLSSSEHANFVDRLNNQGKR